MEKTKNLHLSASPNFINKLLKEGHKLTRFVKNGHKNGKQMVFIEWLEDGPVIPW